MSRSQLRYLSLTVLCSLLVASGCGRTPVATIQPAQPSSESMQVSGSYELHYNAVRADQLPVASAQAYGIERSKNKVLLNVSVRDKRDGDVASDADVQVVAHNLNGQVKNLTLRRIAENQAIYYIGEVGFSGVETLVFKITATPSSSNTPIEATLTREFFAD